MSWVQVSVCDKCGKTLVTNQSKKEANDMLRELGGYTVYGYHLCPSCFNPINKKYILNKGKDKY